MNTRNTLLTQYFKTQLLSIPDKTRQLEYYQLLQRQYIWTGSGEQVRFPAEISVYQKK